MRIAATCTEAERLNPWASSGWREPRSAGIVKSSLSAAAAASTASIRREPESVLKDATSTVIAPSAIVLPRSARARCGMGQSTGLSRRPSGGRRPLCTSRGSGASDPTSRRRPPQAATRPAKRSDMSRHGSASPSPFVDRRGHSFVPVVEAESPLRVKTPRIPGRRDRRASNPACGEESRTYTAAMANGTCRIVALGGLGEVGKNLTVYESDGSIVVVDAGLAFPRDEHLGVDLVLPDFSYLRERADSIRAVILTHGHEDHVGGLPYLLREVRVPEIWATRLTLGLVKSKLDEHGLLRAAELREVHPDDPPR